MKRNRHILFISCTILAMFAAAAFAEVREGIFQIEVYGPEDVKWDPGQNSGFEKSWYAYPQSEPGVAPPPTWWNEWFWNDPYIRGGKWVQISFDYKLINVDQPGQVFATINWTNGQWVGQNTPPIPDGTYDPEIYIERLTDYGVVWGFDLNPENPAGSWDSDKYWLPIDYNPEWVSVDVQGMGNVAIYNGIILHECVPEPATMLLLGFGGLALRKRK